MASAKAIAQVQTQSRTENQSQQNIIQGVAPLLKNVLAVNSWVRDVSIASGVNIVSHMLGQSPVGMWITSSSGAVSVYGQSYDSSNATFTSSAAVTVDIIFF